MGGIVVALCFAVWPSPALAGKRPSWNPGPPWAPLHPHSGEMKMISDLFWIMLGFSAIIFIGVVTIIMFGIFRFAAKPGQPEPPQIAGNRTVETVWTIIPFIILIIAFGITVKYIRDINSPPKGSHPLDIVARGHQWWWEFYYPGLQVTTANEVHVPINTPLHFHVESYDVIHSFWVPQLQRQIDANPGLDDAVYVEMNQPGTYGGMCYEYCGDAHAWMKFELIVQSRAAFNAWAHHQQQPAATPTGLASLGEKVFLSHTCIQCHAITGTPAGGAVGPNLTHLGSRWSFAAGAGAMSEAHLEQWVRDPNSFKPGVLMPPYPTLSRHDLQALAAYLLSLK